MGHPVSGPCPVCEVDPAVAFAAGRADAVRRICAWMRAARTPHAQADAIERGDWEDTVVAPDANCVTTGDGGCEGSDCMHDPLRPSK